MSTRSLIGKLNPDGTVTHIYCHFDGYPEGVGQKLIDHWTNPANVDELMALGDLSAVGSKIGSKQDFDEYPRKHKDWCLAYGRDRNETGTEARTSPSEQSFVAVGEDSWAEYLYLFANGEWRGMRTGSESFETIAALLNERAE